MMGSITCEICGKGFKEITNTHLKQHSLTVVEYKHKFPLSKVRSEEANLNRGLASKGKTYEERYGADIAKKMRTIRIEKTTKQMQDISQINIRKEKCGFYKDPEQRNKNISKAVSNPEVIKKRRATMLEKYGTTNTLNINGRFSQSAFDFIKKYLKDNDINENRCYFNKGGINNKEFYQMIYNEERQQYVFVCYDLVILSESNPREIDLILEFNGPFHFTKEEVELNPDEPAVPFHTNKMTKFESYRHDLFKLNHAKEIAKKVLIYWQVKKELVEFV